MKYSKEEVIQYTQEEDVKFIRLAFCDVFGRQKNISVMPDELPRAFEHGIAIDASAIAGFGDGSHSDLLLHPEPDTLMPLPWRPEHGRVMQMFSTITYPDGTPFEYDTRQLLEKTVADAEKAGFEFTFGAEQEFYLYLLDEEGKPTMNPCDEAGYMDIAPEDRGENVRREICLTLDSMGIRPESSHHEVGPGQNEISLYHCDALRAADNAQTFRRVIKLVADRNGLYAAFSQKPAKNLPENTFGINMSVAPFDDETFKGLSDGINKNAKAIMNFLNPDAGSRLPKVHSRHINICAKSNVNPYLAYTLLICAALDGIEGKAASKSFVKDHIPEKILAACGK